MANLYTYFLSILLFAFTLNSKGQSKTDTTISKYTLHDLQSTIENLEEKSRLQQYEIRLLREVKSIDSIHFKNDSTKISFLDKDGKVIQLVRLIYKESRLIDSSYTIFNKDGLLEFKVQKQRRARSHDYWSISRWRYEYDNFGRVIMMETSEPGPRMRKYLYTYNKQGQRIIKEG